MSYRFYSTLLSLLLLITHAWASKSYYLMSHSDTFASQCNEENAIYEIRNDFNLKGATVRIPKGCVLRLNGGSINNGQLYLLSDTKIVGTGEIFKQLIIIVENKNVENVLIDGIEFQGNKNAAKEKDELVVGIRVSSGGSVNNFSISNCKIHGYNAGISLRGSNVTIKDNIFYDNGHEGTIAGVHDSEFDICAGYSPNEPSTSNFIITGNRCLSKNVHRNIDCGELLSEDNIIISNNICVCMEGMSSIGAETFRKSQCILVGYTGLSEKDKGAIISNNYCKDCSWGAIYVRANNTAKTAGKNGYVALITGNYVENVKKTEGSKFGAGIACELRGGSIVSNNIIKNCTQGINIGQVFKNGHTKVYGNSIDNCDYGILNDAVARQVDITNNSVTNVGIHGIAITEAISVSTSSKEKFVNIANNTISLKGEKAIGFFLYNVGTIACRVSENYVHGNNLTNTGIQFRCNSQTSLLTIKDNYISGCHIGISRIAGNDIKGKNYSLTQNVLSDCQTELKGF